MEGKPLLVLLHVPFTGSDDFVFKTKGGKEGWYCNCIASTSTCRRSDSYQEPDPEKLTPVTEE